MLAHLTAHNTSLRTLPLVAAIAAFYMGMVCCVQAHNRPSRLAHRGPGADHIKMQTNRRTGFTCVMDTAGGCHPPPQAVRVCTRTHHPTGTPWAC